MLKFKKVLACSLSITMLAAMSTVAFASDAEAKRVILDGSGSNQSFTISDETLSKEQSEKIAQDILNNFKQRKGELSIYSYLDNVNAMKESSYSDGVVKSSFDCDLYVDGFPGYVVETSGSSRDFWTGSKPIEADSINSSDTFSYDTFGPAGLSISYPASAGADFSVGNKTAVLTYPEHTDDYKYYHTFDGVVAKTGVLGSITNYEHTHSTTMKFGNRTVTAVSTDSTIVW